MPRRSYESIRKQIEKLEAKAAKLEAAADDKKKKAVGQVVTLMKKLDKAAADAQRKDYPLTTCIVAGGELGSMGEPSEMVVAGRLLRFCCASCHPKVKADPLRYLRIIDEAWRAKGRYLPERAADEPARENRKSD